MREPYKQRQLRVRDRPTLVAEYVVNPQEQRRAPRTKGQESPNQDLDAPYTLAAPSHPSRLLVVVRVAAGIALRRLRRATCRLA